VDPLLINNLHPSTLLSHLKIISEYDRFTTWVKQKRRCPDDDLENTINSISIQYIRSIMKGVDEAAGRLKRPTLISLKPFY
jgi:hypothetical protein